MDKLTAIRSFVEVANCTSFTKAAERLGLSRLQVSRHVQDIELWLNQRLLHRTTRRVSLTTAGESALVRFERILNEAAELEVEALNQTDELSGTIRLAAPTSFTQYMLLEVVEKFTQSHPSVTVELFASDHIAQLVDERIDIALRFTRQPDENLIARKLITIDSVICASPDYLMKHGEPKQVEELRNHNCFLHLDRSNWEFIKDNQQEKVEVRGNIKADNASVLCQAALHGKGIAYLPCDLANKFIEQGKLKRILTDYSLPSSALWAVYLSPSYQLPVVRRFIDFIAEIWADDIKAVMAK